MKKYDEEVSMGNAGIEQYGLFKVDGQNKIMKVRFKPLSMFGFFGYLSQFDVRGEAAKVLTVYDVIDNYNDPVKSKDEKVRGKKFHIFRIFFSSNFFILTFNWIIIIIYNIINS